MDKTDGAELIKELRNIKRLLGLLALKMGATQEEVGLALNLDRSGVSRMLPGVRTSKRT